MKSIINILLNYIIIIFIWFSIFYVIDETKNNSLLSIDTIITGITILSLTFQNLKIDKIKFIQDKVANRISIDEFSQKSWHLFLILGIFILPVIIYELPKYISDDEMDNYYNLGKQLIVLAWAYSFCMYFLTFLGKDIDTSTKNNIDRKYGVFYGILFLLYCTIKWTATR